jgi:hypothetical protein
MIESIGEMNKFIEGNSGKEGIDWEIKGDRVYFRREKKS